VTLLTERDGVLSAMARRARAPSARRSIVLEPFHTLSVELAKGGGELGTLRSSIIDRARTDLLSDERRLGHAGLATRWVRTLSPLHSPEPEVFVALEALLDRLAAGAFELDAALALFGLQLLTALGYGLELGACARCARARPEGRAGYVSASGGGVVCDACRMGVVMREPAIAGALLDALVRDERAILSAPAADVAAVLHVVRAAIDLRARGVGSKRGGS